MRDLSTQENMYTYHYFKKREITKKLHPENYLLSAILLCSTAYLISTIFILFK